MVIHTHNITYYFNITFKNNHIIFSCILRRQQSKIKILIFANNGVSVYVFIDKKFTQFYEFFLHFFKFFKRVRGFDNQFALIENITHVTEIIMNLNDHVKTLFMYVTKLQH